MTVGKIVLLAGLIPLVFSIGLLSNLPNTEAQDYIDRIYREASETECREGQWLVLRIQGDYVCTADTTALRWEQLGMAEIISRGSLDEQVQEYTSPAEPEIEEPETSELPPQVCTMDYNPVCGVDGRTYGNMCVMESFEVELDYVGECEEQVPDDPYLGILDYTQTPPPIDPEKGYFVAEIADGLYWLIDGVYQMMFLTTGEGVIVVDAPDGMRGKILQAISDVTSEPVTHMVYSHIHTDHVGAAHIFPEDTTYIAHIDAANHLKMKNDPNRPIPTITFEDTYTLEIGNQVLELSYEGAFHSKGDIVIYAPEHKVLMVVDLFHPEVGPFYQFGITKDMNAHIAIHDILLEEYDFDVIIPAHEPILATKEHLQTSKEFTLDVQDNVVKALQTVNYMEIQEQYGAQGHYAVFDAYFDAVAEHCADLTLEKWNDKLRELEPFMIDNCKAMTFHVWID